VGSATRSGSPRRLLDAAEPDQLIRRTHSYVGRSEYSAPCGSNPALSLRGERCLALARRRRARTRCRPGCLGNGLHPRPSGRRTHRRRIDEVDSKHLRLSLGFAVIASPRNPPRCATSLTARIPSVGVDSGAAMGAFPRVG
jgi:hypothetical protein